MLTNECSVWMDITGGEEMHHWAWLNDLMTLVWKCYIKTMYFTQQETKMDFILKAMHSSCPKLIIQFV